MEARARIRGEMLNDDPTGLPVPRHRIYNRKAGHSTYNTCMIAHEYHVKESNKIREEIELLLKETNIV